MAFSDVLQSLGRFIGLYSDNGPEPQYEGDDYDRYPQPDDRYDDQGVEEPDYQSGYGTGASYVRAGAKPKSPPPRRPAAEPAPRGGQARRQPQSYRQDNVIPIDRGERDYNGERDAYAERGYDDRDAYAERDTYAGRERQPVRERHIDSDQPHITGLGSTIIFCVRRKDDSSQIINYLLDGVNVILNFEEVDDAQCQRVLDMVSGAAFALQGTVERISHRNYLAAPTGVEIVRSETQARSSRDGMYAARF